MKITMKHLFPFLAVVALLSLGACNKGMLSGSKLTSANYDQITLGMSQAQVQTILGPPTTIDSKDLVIFKKTTFRYENGKKFAIITFKNDEVDSKDTNLGREP
jgi:outer membrane protein assembly factor BamE (lipoprotein component of BamABCDE complex)